MGKGGAKIQVTEYGMSIHYGICTGPCELKGIIIKEKPVLTGQTLTGTTSVFINEPELFGGVKKEGGVAGTMHFLDGDAAQVLPDQLAQKLGRANGADAPGYRGIASIWLTGEGYSRLVGFYWSANIPYLPGTWAEMRRVPIGLTASIAMVPRDGEVDDGESASFVTIDSYLSEPEYDGAFNWTANSPDGRYAFSNSWLTLDLDTETIAFVDPSALPSIGHAAIDNDGTVYALETGTEILRFLDFGNGAQSSIQAYPELANGLQLFVMPDDSRKLVAFSTTNNFDVFVYDVDTDMLSTVINDAGSLVRVLAQDSYGDVWVAGNTSGDMFFQRVIDNGAGSAAADYVEWTGGGTPSNLLHTPSGWIVTVGTSIYLLDEDDFSVIDTRAYGGSYSGLSAFSWLTGVPPGTAQFWLYGSDTSGSTITSVEKIDAATLDTIDSRDLADWEAGDTPTEVTWLPYADAIVSRNNASFMLRYAVLRYFGTISNLKDANPAHIIYESLTNTDWGMGSPTNLIDTASFEAAAQTLYDEFFGLFLIWTRQASIQDFIQEVLDHIQAVLFVDPATGLLTLKLIRGDYDVGTLDIITPDNADLSSFSRKLWGEIVNEIVVTWTNPVNEEEETVTVHDLASIVTQGIVPDSRNYYGIRYAALAARIAQRDLRASGAPLASCEAEVDRSFWAIRPASVVKVTWPEHGLSGVVFRVTNVDYGRPGDLSIKLSLVEDVFGLDIGEYTEPATGLWEDPSEEPEPLEVERVITLPLFMVADAVGITDSEDATYPEVLAGILGSTSSADTFNYDVWTEIALPDGTLEWQSIGTNNVLGHAELIADLAAEATSAGVGFTNSIGQTSATQGGFVIIGDFDDDETEMEITLIIDPAAVDLDRGVLDTVPMAWPAGTSVWFVDGSTIFEDTTVRSAGEEVNYRLLTRTSQGLLGLSDAATVNYTLTERPWLPNRPANVAVDGVLFNTAATPVDMTERADPWVTVSWANRNRLTEDSLVLSWTDATQTPETDQTTTVTVLTVDGLTTLATHDELTGTSFNVPDASFGTEDVVLLRVSSSRTDADGTFESLQAHGIYVRIADLTFDETVTWDSTHHTWDEA